MKNAGEIGFWLDLGDRATGMAGNAFRWVFATKRRLQIVLLVLVVLATAWGCSRNGMNPVADTQGQATPTDASTAKACPRAMASTAAEKAAANLSLQLCTSPGSENSRRATAKRLLTTSAEDGTETSPDTLTVEHFVTGIPNQVQQVGGVEENGNSTVLATSATARFLWTFDKSGKLVEVQNITVTTDATNAPTDAPNASPAATESATPEPTQSATTR